jgi:RNA polymerase sigma-70 factor (ECF subfamily)
MAVRTFEPTGGLGNCNSPADGDVVSDEELSHTSTTLIQMAKSHNEAGWRRLVDAYGLMIYKWCRYGGLPPEDARDVCQEVFSAVFRKIGGFRRDRPGDSFRKWLSSITRNKIRDYWRAHKRAEQGVGGTAWLQKVSVIAESSSGDDSSTFASQEDGQESQRLAIAQIRTEVSNRDWSIVERLIFEDKRPAEVAEEFGVSPNVVYLVKSRILSRLRDCLDSCQATDGAT